MRNIFFNSKKSKEEALEKERLKEEAEAERIAIEKLKSNNDFQKYIVEKRIKRTIAALDTIQNLPKEKTDLEVEIRKGTINALRDIFNSIL